MVSPAVIAMKYGIIAGIILAVIVAVYLAGHKAGSDGTQARWDKAEAQHALARAAQSEAHRAKWRRLQNELQTVTDTLTAQQMATTAELNRTVADINADNLRLRERFQGCRSAVPETTSTLADTHDPASAGLSAADQAFLVRAAARADGYAHQLIACQAYIESL